MDVIEPARFAYESDFSSALRAEKAIRMVSQVATATVFADICGKNANFPTQASIIKHPLTGRFVFVACAQ